MLRGTGRCRVEMSNLRHDERGFTLIEVIVASVVLLVGILGVATIVNAANGSTTSTKAREQGLALARDLTEAARSARYQQLEPSTVVGKLKAMPGFSDVGPSGWTIVRRGIRYTVSFGVCSVDDPSDGTGAHVANTFCNRPAVLATAATCKGLIGYPPKINGTGASGGDAGDCGLDTNLDGMVDGLVQTAASDCPPGKTVAAGTCDAQPNDFKRLVTLVTWDRGSGSRYVLQQATVPFPGLSAYAAISSFQLNGYGQSSGVYVVTDRPAAPTQLTFAATTSQPADRVDWLLGGVDQGPFTSWSGSSGTLTWPLGNIDLAETETPAANEVVDGSYVIGARVQDAAGIHGIERSVSVQLNRRWAFAPPQSSFSIAGSALDAQGRPTQVTASWSAPPDHDILGYRLERAAGGSTTWNAVTGCATITARTCTDTSPPMGSVSYRVRALDTDPDTGALRPGQPSVVRSVTAGNQPPTVPTFSANAVNPGSSNNKQVQLWWNASTDPDDAIQSYEIYRSGCTSSTLVGTAVGTTNTLTDTAAPKNKTCTYNIRAKDVGGAYSAFSPDYTVST
jgi:prepilin-type N-terminal cleavage/methylation domain-containing protein